MAVYRNIFLGLGSNLGDREMNLLLAIKKINEQSGTVYAVSSLYKSEPWGKADQPDFLNQVIALESELPPAKLLENLHSIELDLGRKRKESWGPRTLDIDIIFFGQEIVDLENLKIPHPAMAERKFVLIPLCEIKPGFIHPTLKKTCLELLRECKDPLGVEVFDPTKA